MYSLSIILNRIFVFTLSLCLSRVLCSSKLSIKPAFSVVRFPILLPHAILFIDGSPRFLLSTRDLCVVSSSGGPGTLGPLVLAPQFVSSFVVVFPRTVGL